MQLTTPREPAMAVSTAINTLSNLPQSMEPLPPPSPEGRELARLDEKILLSDMIRVFD